MFEQPVFEEDGYLTGSRNTAQDAGSSAMHSSRSRFRARVFHRFLGVRRNCREIVIPLIERF